MLNGLNFSGAGLLAKEWEAFTPTVNDLIKVKGDSFIHLFIYPSIHLFI